MRTATKALMAALLFAWAVAALLLVGRADAQDRAKAAAQAAAQLPSMSHMHPAWSPDGRWIAFVARPAEGGGQGDLYLVDPTGSEVRQVTATPIWELQPSWSPDARRLVFQRASEPRVQWRLGFIGIDGSDRRKVTVPEGSASVPAFSPDGDSLAVSVGKDGSSAIHVMAVDGSGRRLLTPGEGEHSRPEWSPDGSQLLYDHRPSREAPWQLYVVDRDGSGLRQLTTEGGDDGDFSPDGSQIVFATDRSGERYEVWIMNADGSGQHSLTADMDGSASSATFSPDGGRIAFSVFRDGRSSLYVMDASGTGKRLVRPDRPQR